MIPRFDWTVNVANLSAALGAVAVGATLFANLRSDVDAHGRWQAEAMPVLADARGAAVAVEHRLDAIESDLTAIEARVAAAAERLATKDVADAELRTRFGSIETLMKEVRDELRLLSVSRGVQP